MQSPNRKAAICVTLVFAFTLVAYSRADSGETPRNITDESLDLLKQHQIATDTNALIEHLEQQLPNSDADAQIARLIEQLNSDKFTEREAATRKLATFDRIAKARLIEAAKSENSEVASRARHVLKEIESNRNAARQQATIHAAIRVLGERKSAAAAPVLLAIVNEVEEQSARDAASEALWASVDESHAKLLREALSKGRPAQQTAAIVALEVAIGKQAIEPVAAFLKSDSESLQLAAVRALINHQPQKVARVLLDLVSSKDDETSALAEALLRAQTGAEVEPDESTPVGAAWKAWADKHLATTKLKPLGSERLDLSHGRQLFVESFSRAVADAKKGYGRLLHESTAATQASVADGKLRLEQGETESDQRLALTSQKLTGRPTWPDRLEIRARMGGEEGGSGAWHIGISVGQIKVLYHPAYSGGGFRLEDVDSHEYIVSNEDMGFTPSAGALQDVVIKVQRTAKGATFDIEITQGEAKFTRSAEVTNEQLGEYNRIGLERSGREGGAALFDSVSLKLGR